MFKDTICRLAEEICGPSKNNNANGTEWYKKYVEKEGILGQTMSNNYSKSKEQRRIPKELVREAKLQQWDEFGQQIEQNSGENAKVSFRTLKSILKEKCALQYIEDEKRNLRERNNQISKRWQKEILCRNTDR